MKMPSTENQNSNDDKQRALWLTVRAALLMIADAIARHYGLRTRNADA